MDEDRGSFYDFSDIKLKCDFIWRVSWSLACSSFCDNFYGRLRNLENEKLIRELDFLKLF